MEKSLPMFRMFSVESIWDKNFDWLAEQFRPGITEQ
jgi:hypothetical protein